MATTDTINLKLFVGENGRYTLAEPFVSGGFRYATDGRICIRMKCDEPDTVLPDKKFPPCEDLFSIAPLVAAEVEIELVWWDKVVDVVRVCCGCGGTGIPQEPDPDDDFSDPDEYIPPAWPDGSCGECLGMGRLITAMRYTVCGITVNPKYIFRIDTLPNVRVGCQKKNPPTLYFTFDGGDGMKGDGLLMGLRE